MSYIYKITNLITNKSYIGETNRTVSIRWAQHKIRAKDVNNTEYLYNSIRKYGINNLKSHIRGYNTVQVQDEHNHEQEHEDENKVTENVVNDIINNTVSE